MSTDIVSIRLGSRRFAPHPLMTLLALALIAAMLLLGRWQLHRAQEKQALYAAFATGTDSTQVLDASTPALPRFQHVEAAGHYDPAHQILIDNMSDARGRVGYYVITPFVLDGGGLVLVNRGWVPLGASRTLRPRIEVAADRRSIHGRTDHLPVPGIRLGASPALRPPYPIVASFPTRGDIAPLLPAGALSAAAELVLLDASEADGYQREWQAPGFPPVRHLAYAVQWFGLAAALAVIYLVTNLRPVTAAGGTP